MKKKHFIGLSILLLVLSLGLFSTCYASVYIEWTDIQLKNIIYKMAMNHNANYSSAYVNLINSKSSEIQTIVNDLNNNRYVAIGAVSDNSTLFVKITDVDNGWYVHRNQPVLSGGSWYKVYTINISSNNISISSNTSDNSSSWIWGDYMYIGRNTFTNTSFTTKKWSGNTHIPDNFFDEWYWTSAMPFIFVAKSATQNADVYYFEDLPLYNASGEDLYIGQLFVPSDSNIIYWTKDNYYYKYNDWNMRQLPTDSFYLQYSTTENDVAVYDVYLRSKYIYENTIYSSVWADDSTEPYTLAIANFYIKNNNTIVVNGAINPGQTFSGDYKDRYDDDLQNQQDIENIEQAINDTINNTDDVDNFINESLSGDINFWGEELGYSPLENPFTTFLLDLLENVYDALTKRGNVQLDFNHHGTTNWIINTDDFTTPPSSVKNLVTFLLIFLYIYGNYVFFHYLLSLLETAKIDKAIAVLGTDEFYDTDIM